MALNAPIITYPTTEPVISTNLNFIELEGICDVGVSSILVNFNGVQTSGTIFSPSGWFYGPVELIQGTNTFIVTATSGNIASGPDSFTVIYDPDMESDLITLLPTGFVLKQQRDSVKLVVPTMSRSDFVGYNFYGSEEPGGGQEGFDLLTQSPITNIDFTEEKFDTALVTEQTVVGKPLVQITDNKTFIIVDKTETDYTTTVTQKSLSILNYISYTHNRVTNPLLNATKPITEKNHYVVTSVFFDAANKQLVESNYSEELSGKPFVIDTNLKDIEQRTEEDFRVGIIDQILQSNKNIDVKPGTVLRDSVINPSSTLLARNYAMLRFFSAAQSFATLLAYDDPDQTGESAPVLTTQNKNELRLALLVPEANAQVVQDLIDTAFDKLAGNLNTVRLPAQQATGQITVYTRRPPDRDAAVQAGAICETLADTVAGTPAVRFIVLSSFILRADPSLNSQYYNQTTRRYEFKLNIRAELAGTVGNQEAGKIITPVSGFDSIFGVVNEDKTRFGQAKESNKSLAERAELAFLSVDSGTESGYYSTAIKNVGVERVIVVGANHPLMQRDLDPIREIHFLGKVDIYIKGVQNKTVVEFFGFNYKKVLDELFTIQSLPFLQFRATNEDIDEFHPIYKVDQVFNQTQSKLYDLDGMVISNDGNVIDIDESIQGFVTGANDIIKVTYSYRKADPIRLGTQPVESIVSVNGNFSGDLSPENYTLIRSDDPLLLGRSELANDAIQFNFVDGLPTGDVQVITGESVILTGVDEVFLQNFGIDESTLVVHDGAEPTPNIFIENIDYSIIPGTRRIPTAIRRVDGGAIADGDTVFADYEAGEVIQIQYEVNDLLLTVQDKIDEMKHLCADVVVKSAQATNIVIRALVILNTGADVTVVDRNIRNKILTFLRQNKLGLSVYQSDIIALIESVRGVSHVVVPITQMTKKDGAQVIREFVPDPDFVPYQLVSVQSYKSEARLQSNTLETGGLPEEFRGIFQDDFLLEMVDSDTAVAEAAGRGYITEDGYIIVSTRHGTDPNLSKWTVTYSAYGETGAKDIILSSIEYADVDAGDLVITYNNGVITTGL